MIACSQPLEARDAAHRLGNGGVAYRVIGGEKFVGQLEFALIENLLQLCSAENRSVGMMPPERLWCQLRRGPKSEDSADPGSLYVSRTETAEILYALGAFGTRDDANLAHHLQRLPVVPVLDDPAHRDAVHAHPAHLDLSAGRGNAHELAPMGAAGGPAGYCHVPFGALLLDGKVNVGESRMVRAHDLLDGLGTAAQLGITGAWLT